MQIGFLISERRWFPLLKKTVKYFNKPSRAAYVFLFPSLLTLSVFVLFPLCFALVVSFSNLDIFLDPPKFVGLNNFVALVSDPRFLNALKNSFYFLLEVPLQIILGLLVAVYLSKNTFFRKSMRSVFFVPTICSLTAMGIVWSFLLDPQIGMVPYYLSVFGINNLTFLHDPSLAMICVILMTVWKNFGMTMIILVAAIQGVPSSYYDAADIDGAGEFKKLWKITIPLIIPNIAFCVVTNIIGSMQVFDQIYVMTQGGPLYSTETLVMYIYDVGFKESPFNLGYASAIAVVLFILIMIITLFTNNYLDKKQTTDL